MAAFDGGAFIVQEIEDCPSDHGDCSLSDDDDDERVLDPGSVCHQTQDIAVAQPSTTHCLFPYQQDSESMLSEGSSAPCGDGKKLLHIVQVDAKDSVNTVVNYNVYTSPQGSPPKTDPSSATFPDLPQSSKPVTLSLYDCFVRIFSNKLFLPVFIVLVMIAIILHKVDNVLQTTDQVLDRVTSTVGTLTSPIQTYGGWAASTLSTVFVTSASWIGGGRSGGGGGGDGDGDGSFNSETSTNGLHRKGTSTTTTDHDGEDANEPDQPGAFLSMGDMYLHRTNDIVFVGHKLELFPIWKQEGTAENQALTAIERGRDEYITTAVQSSARVDVDVKRQMVQEKRVGRALLKKIQRAKNLVEGLRARGNPIEINNSSYSAAKQQRRLQWRWLSWSWSWLVEYFGFLDNTEGLSIVEGMEGILQDSKSLFTMALEKRKSWKYNLGQIMEDVRKTVGLPCQVAKLAKIRREQSHFEPDSDHTKVPGKDYSGEYGQLSMHLETLSHNTCQMSYFISRDTRDRDEALGQAIVMLETAVEEANGFLIWIARQKQLVRKGIWDDLEQFSEGLMRVLDWSSEHVNAKLLWDKKCGLT
ncbi:hypothetical protein VMCG_10793 [Cytospora schulzeri]|uniref:Uncharacterized protein n=1 Tax=Cytospora schulzeri TaxID=448051 RepID=A0A423VA54_9PEZI|nr:hypothetical protein VMCG_10793 [Valsa malicola]